VLNCYYLTVAMNENDIIKMRDDNKHSKDDNDEEEVI